MITNSRSLFKLHRRSEMSPLSGTQPERFHGIRLAGDHYKDTLYRRCSTPPVASRMCRPSAATNSFCRRYVACNIFKIVGSAITTAEPEAPSTSRGSRPLSRDREGQGRAEVSEIHDGPELVRGMRFAADFHFSLSERVTINGWRLKPTVAFFPPLPPNL
jgi:hypothetical protein